VSHVVEVRQPGVASRRLTFDGSLEVGRDSDALPVDDPLVSRRHAVLDAGPQGLVVTDLGSTNGTRVNGTIITAPVRLVAGDVVGVGGVDLVVLTGPDDEAVAAPPTAVEPPAPRPALDALQARSVDGAVLRFRPGTAGERAVPAMAAAVRRAGKRLAGLGPDIRTVAQQICLVDPFPDPANPGQTVTSGSVVDLDRREIWMVVTAEAPPEPPERPLALLLGTTRGGGDAATMAIMLEGYGLSVAGLASPDAQLRDLDLPPLHEATGELRTAMMQSFVAFLVARAGREEFLRMLEAAGNDGVEGAAEAVYGMGLAALEDTWLDAIDETTPKVKAAQFFRLTLRFLRPHLRREVEIFGYMLLALGFTTVFPFVMRSLLDHAIPRRDLNEALHLIGFLGIAFVISLVAGLRQNYLSAFVSSAVTRDLRVSMFTRLQRLSAGWFSRQQEGDILSRLFSDVGQMEQGLSQTIREGIFQVLSLVVSAVVLLTLNPLLAVVTLAGAPLVGLVYKVMAAGSQRRSLAVQEELGTTYTVASENYGAQAVVKAFGLEEREGERFARASDRLFGREVRLQLFGGVFGLSVNMIVTVLRLLILGLGTWLVLHGHLTIGGLVAFITVMGEVITPVTVLTGIGQQVQAAMGSLLRINEILEAAPDVADTDDAIELPLVQDEIRLEKVSFAYTNERPTLEEVDCVIHAGTRVAFVGPTGAGKSSVLQLLMRFYDPDEGAVRFDGQDVRHATLSSLRGQLGVVFQDTFLFDTTVRDNIAMGRPGATDSEVEAAARAAELHEFVLALPRGYSTIVGERGGRLSGGQRQRLAIARALLRDPRIILLDEATSALDPRTERLISETLDRVGEGRTTIAVTHRLTSVTKYDRIFVMSGGRLVEQGTHAELVAAGGVYADLWAEQTAGVVPTEAPFDAVAALSTIPMFSSLDAEALEAAATQLVPVALRPGEQLAEGAGMLAVVRRGTPQVLAPGLDGRLAVATELRPGDTFGVSALLGEETGSVLVAPHDEVGLLVLDADAIARLAAKHPSVSDALTGTEISTPGPRGGERLSRASLLLRPNRNAVFAGPTVEGPGPDEVRRMSGAFRAVR
jgi:ABC-type multidrug transport system fused ATPase/permease subunit